MIRSIHTTYRYNKHVNLKGVIYVYYLVSLIVMDQYINMVNLQTSHTL